MSSAIKPIADLMVSRWAFAGAGHTIQMNPRLANAPRPASLSGYGPTFFALSQPACAIILLGFTAAMLLTTAVLLARRNKATL